MFWRVSQYDDRIVFLNMDEISVALMAEKYPLVIYFQADLVTK